MSFGTKRSTNEKVLKRKCFLGWVSCEDHHPPQVWILHFCYAHAYVTKTQNRQVLNMKDWKICTNIVKHDAITFQTINDFAVAIGKFHFKRNMGQTGWTRNMYRLRKLNLFLGQANPPSFPIVTDFKEWKVGHTKWTKAYNAHLEAWILMDETVNYQGLHWGEIFCR